MYFCKTREQTKNIITGTKIIKVNKMALCWVQSETFNFIYQGTYEDVIMSKFLNLTNRSSTAESSCRPPSCSPGQDGDVCVWEVRERLAFIQQDGGLVRPGRVLTFLLSLIFNMWPTQILTQLKGKHLVLRPYQSFDLTLQTSLWWLASLSQEALKHCATLLAYGL